MGTLVDTSPKRSQEQTFEWKEVNRLLNAALGTAESKNPLNNPTVKMTKRLIQTGGGIYALTEPTDHDVVHLLQVSENERPTKRTDVRKRVDDPCEFVRQLVERGPVYFEATDEDCWLAARDAAIKSKLRGEDCRTLSRVVWSVICIRAGAAAPGMREMV